MLVKDFFHKYELKNKAMSNIKLFQVLSYLGLSDVGIFLRDGTFSSGIGIVNLHPSKGTHWVAYINENLFDSFGCVCLKKLSKFIKKQIGLCLNSENKIEGLTNKRHSYCGSYFLYLIALTKFLEIVFKTSVLNLYYQIIQ